MGVNLPLILVTVYTVDLSIVGKLENSFAEKDLWALVGPELTVNQYCDLRAKMAIHIVIDIIFLREKNFWRIVR